MPPHGERIWVSRDGKRYTARLSRGFLHFLKLNGKWVASVPAQGRDLASIGRDELETLLQHARERG
jgi:hypothetical protein